jgi:hypothetical protein
MLVDAGANVDAYPALKHFNNAVTCSDRATLGSH